MKKFFSLLLMSVLAISVGWAAESVFYTLTPVNGSNNSYAGDCDVDIDGITWNVTGNAQMTPWRIGGKSITGVDREVYSKTAMESTISKVSLEVGAASSITVNSLTLTVASDADFTDQLDEVTATFAANSTIDFTPTSGTAWAKDAYYKFTFNVTVSSGNNRFFEFKKATFYTNEDVPEPTAYNITYPDPQTLVGGSVSGPETAVEGTTVDIAVTPNTGYVLSSLTYNGNDITSAKSFTMPGEDVTIAASFEEETTPEPVEGQVTDQITYTLIGVSGTSYTDWSGKSDNSDAVYAGQSAGSNEAIQLRSKDSNSGIVSTTSGGKLVSVKITFNSNTSAGRTVDVYGSNTAYTDATDLYDSSKQGTKLGSANIDDGATQTITVSGDYAYVGLRSNSGALYLDQVDITWVKEEGALTAPEISGETPFVTSTQVTITNPNETGSIYYTLDGTDPDATSTPYSAAFTLNDAATVKAVVIDGQKSSPISFKEFEKVTSCASLAEVKALTDGTEFVFTGDVTVIHQYSNYIYAQDATGGNLIFGNVGQTYDDGAVIPAGWKGTATVYGGAPEIANPSGFEPSTSTGVLEAVELAPADINVDNFSRYVVVKGATIPDNQSIVVNGTTIALRTNRTTFDWPEDNDGTKLYDVYGISDWNKGAASIMPMSFEEVQAATYTVTFNYNQEQGAVELLNDGTAFEAGDDIMFTVTPNADYTIEAVTITGVKTNVAVQFEDDGKGGYEFQMPADDVNVNITFAAIPRYTITVADDIENGTISDITAETATVGTEVMFEVTPAEHYAIDAVTVNCVNINQAVELTNDGNIYSFVMPADDVVINATFKQTQFQVTLNYNAEQATVDGVVNGWYAADDDITFEVTPAQGYQLTGVTITAGNEAIVPEVAENTYSFIMPESDVNINVATELIPAKTYPINVQAMENGSVVADPIAAAIGETVTLTVTPDEGYELESISVTAGYEIQGSTDPARAPRLMAVDFVSQGTIELTKVDDTHYTFVLPEELPNVLTPNYTDDTQFKVSATFKLAPVPTRVITGKVVDKKGNPLAEVSVVALVKDVEPAGISRLKAEGDLSTTTDENGEFSLEVPADQQYDLTFSKAGYKSQTVGEDEVPGTGLVMAKDYPTAIDAIVADENVAGVKYVSVSGMVSDQPFDGVNIVVIEKVDGTKTVTKIRK